MFPVNLSPSVQNPIPPIPHDSTRRHADHAPGEIGLAEPAPTLSKS